MSLTIDDNIVFLVARKLIPISQNQSNIAFKYLVSDLEFPWVGKIRQNNQIN